MNKATTEQERLNAEMANAGADHQLISKLSNDLAVVHEQLAEAESRWLELAAEAEAAGLSLD